MNRNRGISVIIPFFNDHRFLDEAVDSVYKQVWHGSRLPVEIIIIDDGSTTPDAAEDVQRVVDCYTDLDIRAIELPENRGVSAARNVGLKAAKYDYIFPLDVDNKLATAPSLISGGRGYMDRAVAALEASDDVVFVHCIGERFEGASGPCHLYGYNEKRLLTNFMIDTRIIYRREEALNISGYNEDLRRSEDWDFSISMINERHKQGRPAKVLNIKDPLFFYRVREDRSNLSSRPGEIDAQVAVWKRSPELFRKHFPDVSDDEMVDFLKRRGRRLGRIFNLSRAVGYVFQPHIWPLIPHKIGREFQRVSRRVGARLHQPSNDAEHPQAEAQHGPS